MSRSNLRDIGNVLTTKQSCDWQETPRVPNRAKIAGDNLRTFNPHLDRTMDSVIAMKDWTARTLSDIACEDQAEAGRGFLSMILDRGCLAARCPKPTAEEAVKMQYLRHLSQVKDKIDVLITEAGLSILNLNALENLLFIVNKIGQTDTKDVAKGKKKASKKLAYIIGLNWAEIEDFEEQSAVILQLLKQKDVALARVTGMSTHLK